MEPKASSEKKSKASGELSGPAKPPQKLAINARTSPRTKLAVNKSVKMSEDATSATKIDDGNTIQQQNKPGNTDLVKRIYRSRAPHAPQKPTTMIYLQMIKGPTVEILVGPKKRSFPLPKELLSHYSPVFDRCFNGGFIEGQTQKMELPEDTIEDFEVMIEYIFHHGVGDKLSITRWRLDTVKRCMSFLEYADKYDLGDVSGELREPIRCALKQYGMRVLKPEYIKLVFSLTKDGNCLRVLMAEAALAFQTNYKIESPFEKQETEVEGFQAAMYHALKGWTNTYLNPFQPDEVKCFGKY